MHFPRADISFKPSVGDAVVIHNLLPNNKVDPVSLYGEKASIGEKWTLTKWIRQRPFKKDIL